MIRYFVIATVVVLVIALLATAFVARDLIRIHLKSVDIAVSPKAGDPIPTPSTQPPPFAGDAPWALSALPECLIERRRSQGSLAYVESRMPSGAQRIIPPAELRYADCTISIVGEQAFVRRGKDRFHIPPDARFYRIGDRLALLRTAAGKADLRIYQRSKLTEK